MRTIALALTLVIILSNCIPPAAIPTILPLKNAMKNAFAATAAAGGASETGHQQKSLQITKSRWVPHRCWFVKYVTKLVVLSPYGKPPMK